MARYELVLPRMGESVEEATVTSWKKNVGDKINVDDIIAEVATDKVDSEVPSPVSGIIREIIVAKDSVAKVGLPMAIIEIEGQDTTHQTKKTEKQKPIVTLQSNEYELVLPRMGESIEEATITSWKKNIGDKIQAEDIIVEVATDKVDSEVPSPVSGIIKEILIQKGNVAKVGQPMAIITTSGITNIPTETTLKPDETTLKPDEKTEKIIKDMPFINASTNNNSTPLNKFYSPLVRSIAREENISNQELENIKGTGLHNRVTKYDILEYIKSGRKQIPAPPLEIVGTVKETNQIVPVIIEGNAEVMEMSRMRKLIAEHMLMSKRVSAHVTSCIEVDVTNVVRWRDKAKDTYQKRYNQKLTFTPIFIQAIVEAIKTYPLINISVEGDKIIKHNNINIGMATALPSGDLIVPVIKNADRQNILGITASVNDLANRARNNKLTPDDVKGATYTFTNIGSFGNTIATPIINQPQVAILAIGAIVKKPAVIETPEGDMIAIRHMMYLSHSYDHRVVDGALGGMFVKKISDFLRDWDINTPI